MAKIADKTMLLHIIIVSTLFSVGIGQECCELVWYTIAENEPLPDTTIWGLEIPMEDKINGRDSNWNIRDRGQRVAWARTWTEKSPAERVRNFNLAIKTERAHSPPFTKDNRWEWQNTQVLTNPNNCSLGYYETKYRDQRLFPVYHIFFPSNNGYALGRKDENIGYYRSNTKGEYGLTDLDSYNDLGPGVEILYVDCRKTLLKKLKAKLLKITVTEGELTPSKVFVHDKFTFYNTNQQLENMTANIKVIRTKTDTVEFTEGDNNEWFWFAEATVEVEAGMKILSFLDSKLKLSAKAGYNYKHIDLSGSKNTTSDAKATEVTIVTKVPPMTMVQIVTYSTPTKGTLKLTEYYSLDTRQYSLCDREKLLNQIKQSDLVNTAEFDPENIYNIIVTRKSEVQVDVGYDLHHNVTTSPLSGGAWLTRSDRENLRPN